MPSYMFPMHGAIPDGEQEGDWPAYLEGLRRRGVFGGGSAIGSSITVRKSGQPAAVSDHLAWIIWVEAGSLDEDRGMVAGNPVYEAGGTIEIHELVRSD